MITHPNAKINIGLDVLRKRPDGYHDLESLFVHCRDLQDTLEIDEAPKFSVKITRTAVRDGKTVEIPVDWNPEKDLTVQAYRLMRKDFDLPPVSIRLEKHIPVGAGLGGGSADAAFALRMLSEMFDLYLPDVALECYAAELGSDCPFFIYDSPMFVTGRGEELEPCELPQLEKYELKVVVPDGISVSTKEAYAGIVPAIPGISLKEALRRPVEQWRECVKNDFERTVFAAHPLLASIKESLYADGAVYAAMSGSGSALFGLFPRQ